MKKKKEAAESVNDTIREMASALEGNASKLVMKNSLHVKWLCTYGGGEYVCRELGGWLNKEGIVHEITLRYSPESNSKPEGLDRKLLYCARYTLCGISDIR